MVSETLNLPRSGPLRLILLLRARQTPRSQLELRVMGAATVLHSMPQTAKLGCRLLIFLDSRHGHGGSWTEKSLKMVGFQRGREDLRQEETLGAGMKRLGLIRGLLTTVGCSFQGEYCFVSL